MSDTPHRHRASLLEPTADLNEQLITKVVHHFYSAIREDTLLGPIFNQVIKDWEQHLQIMVRFWSAVMGLSRNYEGRPMPKHIHLPIDARHFDHWLELFGSTVRKLCSVQVAALFCDRATTIARSLEMGVAFHSGASIKLGERYRVSAVETKEKESEQI